MSSTLFCFFCCFLFFVDDKLAPDCCLSGGSSSLSRACHNKTVIPLSICLKESTIFIAISSLVRIFAHSFSSFQSLSLSLSTRLTRKRPKVVMSSNSTCCCCYLIALCQLAVLKTMVKCCKKRNGGFVFVCKACRKTTDLRSRFRFCSCCFFFFTSESSQQQQQILFPLFLRFTCFFTCQQKSN